MALEASRIFQLSGRKGVDETVVSKFLFELNAETLDMGLVQLAVLQAAHPEYSHKTFAAIQTGILEHFQ